jgi:hypothetical protein
MIINNVECLDTPTVKVGDRVHVFHNAAIVSTIFDDGSFTFNYVSDNRPSMYAWHQEIADPTILQPGRKL